MTSTGASIARGQRRDRLGRDVRDDDVGRRQRLVGVDAPGVDLDAVQRGVLERRRDRRLFDVDAEHRRETEQRRCDGQHAGSAADVEERARLELLQEPEAELRRRMRAGAERAPRVDDDGERVVVGPQPRRPDPQAADADGTVEAPPAVLPPGLDVGSLAVSEEVPEPLLARRVGVGDELDAGRGLDLFEALREELDHRRARLLGAFVPDLHGDAAEQAQRNALFSFSKKLSSWR